MKNLSWIIASFLIVAGCSFSRDGLYARPEQEPYG